MSVVTYPGISFDNAGVCNFCLNYRKREPLEEQRLVQQQSERQAELEKGLKFALDFLKVPEETQGKFFENR